MKYGLPQAIRAIGNGSGRQLMPAQKKLPDVMSETGAETVPEGFGNHSRPYIADVPCVIRISGQHMEKYFLRKGIVVPFRNRAEKQIILKD